jgi:hypothetical protein
LWPGFANSESGHSAASPAIWAKRIDFGQVVVKLQDIVVSQRFGTSQRRARRARQTGGLARLIIQPSFD